MRCPICYEGVMLESDTGSWCSRRYAHTDPCGFEAGLCSSTADWDAAVERYRDQLAEEDHERVAGDSRRAAIESLTLESTSHGLARLSPSPAATSPTSPPAPTSPDGAGASCGLLAGAFTSIRFWAPIPDLVIEMAPVFQRPTCKACGSPVLEQSDTSDHPGVVRCDACGLVQV